MGTFFVFCRLFVSYLVIFCFLDCNSEEEMGSLKVENGNDKVPINLRGLYYLVFLGNINDLFLLTSLPFFPRTDLKRSFFTFSTGKVGELTVALSDLLWDDMVAGPEKVPVLYE
ncbi:hypothetical protein NC653_027869 [Populus alba x Populus x berolinensis]|uniref:Uncharacterized protein n=1 Tax=Populus alba x Populus x berolinensis TaxID=444605 RepID=A0AAD6M745_9ROSI|nr:hypothetical protein NC653_027869 [Populus alba x Populus x berolinensis]